MNRVEDVTLDSRAIGQLEHKLMTEKRNQIYIALEDIEDTDFFWSDKEIERFDRLWNKKFPLTEMAKELRRSEIAVLFLALDRVLREELKPRKGWKIW